MKMKITRHITDGIKAAGAFTAIVAVGVAVAVFEELDEAGYLKPLDYLIQKMNKN